MKICIATHRAENTVGIDECPMLQKILTNTKSYRFGTTNLNFTLCLNKEYVKNWKEKSECYIVELLRDEDCFSKSRTAYEVSHIFSKDNSAPKYSNLLFMDKRSDLDILSEKVISMIADDLKWKCCAFRKMTRRFFNIRQKAYRSFGLH